MKDATLWKQIVSHGIISQLMAPPIRQAVTDAIITSPIIVGGRIVGENIKGEDFGIHEYAGMAIPFGRFFYEYQIFATDRLFNYGMLVESPIDKSKEQFEIKITLIVAFDLQNPAITQEIYFEMKDGKLVLNHLGGVTLKIEDHTPPEFQKLSQDELYSDALTTVTFLADLLMILGCKNVNLADRGIERSFRRRAAERTLNPTERYHVLTVRPTTGSHESSDEEMDSMPRHVCRGHFKEYGPDFGKGLLFGKLAGRFYTPPHMKGDAKNGTVRKDYQLPPK